MNQGMTRGFILALRTANFAGFKGLKNLDSPAQDIKMKGIETIFGRFLGVKLKIRRPRIGFRRPPSNKVRPLSLEVSNCTSSTVYF